MKDKLRICYLGDGQSIHTKRWVEHFSKLGHEVHLITYSDAKFDGVTVHHLKGQGILAFIKWIFQCRMFIREIDPDIVHAHFATDFGFLAALSGFHPLVISPWGSDIVRQPEESVLFKFMVKYALKKADAIQCGDGDMEARIKTLIGNSGAVRNIGWGVDSESFTPISVSRTNELRVLYLRISHDNYRTNTLLEAMPEVLSRHKNLKFIILKKGEHLDRTLDAVKKMDAGDRVEFIEPVPHSEMPALLNSCDIYLDTVYNPLPGCGIGITALEAMSCGLPLVITNTKGSEKYITHKVSGYVYRGMDHKALVDALDEVISNPGMRKELGKNAREYILKNQSWPVNMNIIESLYRELIKKGDGK